MSTIPAPIAAIRVRRDEPINSLLAEIVAALRSNGVRLGGLLQEEIQGEDGCCMETWLRDISDGTTVRVSQALGRHARGCRLDPNALAAMAVRVERSVEEGLDLLIVNRFGKAEAGGSGLRAAIERAIVAGAPVLIGVRDGYAEAWNSFHDGMALTLAANKGVALGWCRAALRGEVGAETGYSAV